MSEKIDTDELVENINAIRRFLGEERLSVNEESDLRTSIAVAEAEIEGKNIRDEDMAMIRKKIIAGIEPNKTNN